MMAIVQNCVKNNSTSIILMLMIIKSNLLKSLYLLFCSKYESFDAFNVVAWESIYVKFNVSPSRV